MIKEIQVVSKVNTSNLIKDATYTAISIRTRKNLTSVNTAILQRIIHIKGLGYNDINNFKLLNGDNFDNVPDFNELFNNRLDPKKNYTNNLVRCVNAENCKNLTTDELYFVEKQIQRAKNRIELKLRGIKNTVSFYRFEEIPLSEQRNLKIKNLNNEKIETGENIRKFLSYSEKEKICIIFELLYKVSFQLSKTKDISNINTDIIKMILNKGKKYNIIEEDLTKYLNVDVNSILEKLMLS